MYDEACWLHIVLHTLDAHPGRAGSGPGADAEHAGGSPGSSGHRSLQQQGLEQQQQRGSPWRKLGLLSHGSFGTVAFGTFGTVAACRASSLEADPRHELVRRVRRRIEAGNFDEVHLSHACMHQSPHAVLD